ncbi:hypothetical protein HYX13_05035 [Candidatus Woesearchaeota archaeon]|nr:hypothetical protein [Candidatus Woesearchaeota archaeon]
MVDTYFEKNLVINNREVKYKGKFKVEELFRTINKTLTEKGYTKREKKTEETVTDEGRTTLIELRPFKEKTEYVTLMIKIRIHLEGITEKTEDLEGVRHKFQQGKILLTFDAWSLTDYQQRWGMKPWVFFFKGVINKYLYTFPMEAGFTGELVGDTGYIVGEIKKLLNSYEEKEGKGEKEVKKIKEEEVRKSAEEEMKKEMEEMRKEGNSAGWGEG